MLTGELTQSSGTFYLDREDTLMGYCPQENALDPLLTVREMLKVYAQVRGIPAADCENVSEAKALTGRAKTRASWLISTTVSLRQIKELKKQFVILLDCRVTYFALDFCRSLRNRCETWPSRVTPTRSARV